MRNGSPCCLVDGFGLAHWPALQFRTRPVTSFRKAYHKRAKASANSIISRTWMRLLLPGSASHCAGQVSELFAEFVSDLKTIYHKKKTLRCASNGGGGQIQQAKWQPLGNLICQFHELFSFSLCDRGLLKNVERLRSKRNFLLRALLKSDGLVLLFRQKSTPICEEGCS